MSNTAKNNMGGATESPIRTKKFREVQDELIGKTGSSKRQQFEAALTLHLIPIKIREFRKLHNLTQTELGARLGVKKTQISKLERSAVNVTIETLLKVFTALNVKVNISFEPADTQHPQKQDKKDV